MSSLAPAQDHPRVCGENFQNLLTNLFDTGSPPRVRGKHIGLGQLGAGTRITPACAGKTRQLGWVKAVE